MQVPPIYIWYLFTTQGVWSMLYLYISSYLHKLPSCFIFRPSYWLLHLSFLLSLGFVTSSVSCDTYCLTAPSKFLPLLQVLAIHKHPFPPGLIAFTSCMVPLSGIDIGYYSVILLLLGWLGRWQQLNAFPSIRTIDKDNLPQVWSIQAFLSPFSHSNSFWLFV